MTGMRARRRIVVGVDGTAASAAAVRWAVREGHGCATPPCTSSLPATTTAGSVRRTLPRPRRRTQPGRMPPPGLSSPPRQKPRAAAFRQDGVKAELTDEPPARALVDRTAGAEMLVLGTTRPGRQRPGQPPEAMGPVTRACLRHAHCPVVIVAAHDQLAVYSLPPEPAQARGAPPSCARSERGNCWPKPSTSKLKRQSTRVAITFSIPHITHVMACPGPLAGIGPPNAFRATCGKPRY